nr:sugar ABC transporter substrate-binding protein [uncultured Blautia sp.]
MNRKKIALFLTMTVLGTTVLSGCGATGESKETSKKEETGDGRINLSIAWWGNETRHEYTQELLDAYTEEHPNVTFTASPTSWDGYWEKLATQTAGGSCPDIVQMDYSYIITYAQNKTLADLQKFVDDETIDVSSVEESLVKSGNIGGTLAGIPLSTSMATIGYNPDVLKEAGLEVPDADWTWEDFSNICKTVKEKTGKTGLANNYGDCLIFNYWVRQHGEVLFREDNTALGYEDDQILVDFMDLHKDLVDAGAMVTPDEWTQSSANPEEARLVPKNEAALVFGSNTIANMVKTVNDKIGLITPPMNDEGTKALWLKPGMYFSISASSSDEKQKAAAEFVNWFLNSEEAGGKTGTDRGIPASSKVRDALKEGTIGNIDQKEKEMFDYYDVAASVSGECPPPDPEGTSEINKVFQDVMNRVFYGQMTSEEAAASFREQVNKILAKNKN